MQQTEKNATKLLKRHGFFDRRKDAEKSLEACDEQLWKSLGVCEELGVCGGFGHKKPITKKPIAAPSIYATKITIADTGEALQILATKLPPLCFCIENPSVGGLGVGVGGI